MTLPRIVVILAILLPSASPAPAERAGEQGGDEEVRSILEGEAIGLEDLFRIAEQHSPTLEAACADIRAAMGRARQAGLYPNPVLGFEVEELSTGDAGDRKDKITLAQSLMIGGRRGATVDTARAEREAAIHGFREARTEVFRRVHSLWAELLYLKETRAALEDLLRVANATLQIAETRFEARAAPESQVTTALLEVYELEVAEGRRRQRETGATAELSAELGGVVVPVDRLAGDLDRSGIAAAVDSFPEAALEENPALRAARSRIEAAEASLREARAARIPDLGVFVAYGKDRAIDQGFLEAGVSLPLPIFDRNQGRIMESRASIVRRESEARIVRNELAGAFEVARTRYETSRERLRNLTERMLPAAERGLAQAQEGYRLGRLPFLELIDAQRTLADVRLQTLETRRDVAVASAEVMSLVRVGPYEYEGEE